MREIAGKGDAADAVSNHRFHRDGQPALTFHLGTGATDGKKRPKKGMGLVRRNTEGAMAKKTKVRKIPELPYGPSSFTRADLRKAIKKVASLRRQKKSSVSDGSK